MSFDHPASLRIMLVDDHPIFREGLKYWLRQRPGWTIVAEAGDSESALSDCKRQQPDVAVVDLSLGKDSGLELIPRLRESRPRLRILACDTQDETLYAERALQAGAHGYIEKRESGHTVCRAIAEIATGRFYIGTGAAEKMLVHRQRGSSGLPRLTRRELQVLDELGAGRSIPEIAAKLQVGRKTVETYRDRIKTKLGLETCHQVVHFATRRSIEARLTQNPKAR